MVGYCWQNAFGEKFQSTATEILVQIMLKRLKRRPILNSPTVSGRFLDGRVPANSDGMRHQVGDQP
jgi:hypothetical protein